MTLVIVKFHHLSTYTQKNSQVNSHGDQCSLPVLLGFDFLYISINSKCINFSHQIWLISQFRPSAVTFPVPTHITYAMTGVSRWHYYTFFNIMLFIVNLPWTETFAVLIGVHVQARTQKINFSRTTLALYSCVQAAAYEKNLPT